MSLGLGLGLGFKAEFPFFTNKCLLMLFARRQFVVASVGPQYGLPRFGNYDLGSGKVFGFSRVS